MRSAFVSRILVPLLVLSTLTFAGCLEEKPAAVLDTKTEPPAANTTVKLVIPTGKGAIGNRVCLQSATMCYPGGGLPMGGGPTSGLSGAQGNPYTFPVNGTVQSAKIVVKWSGSGPGANTNYEVVVTQRPAGSQGTCTGGFGGGGGGQGSAVELARKTGPSPLTIDIADAKWNAANKCMRLQLYLTSRAPAGFVGISSGDTFTIDGEYTTKVEPTPVTKSAAMGAVATRGNSTA